MVHLVSEELHEFYCWCCQNLSRHKCQWVSQNNHCTNWCTTTSTQPATARTTTTPNPSSITTLTSVSNTSGGSSSATITASQRTSIFSSDNISIHPSSTSSALVSATTRPIVRESPNRRMRAATISGSVLGVVVLLFIAVGIVILWRRRMRERERMRQILFPRNGKEVNISPRPASGPSPARFFLSFTTGNEKPLPPEPSRRKGEVFTQSSDSSFKTATEGSRYEGDTISTLSDSANSSNRPLDSPYHQDDEVKPWRSPYDVDLDRESDVERALCRMKNDKIDRRMGRRTQAVDGELPRSL